MIEQQIIIAAVTTLGSIVVGLGGGWLLFRGKRVEQETEETKVEASATDAFLKGQTAFQEYVDRVVQARVDAAVKDFERQLAEMREQWQTVRDESHEMNNAIRARETQLWLWNIRERPGPMPALPHPILARLGITHLSPGNDLEDTEPIHPT